MTVHNRLRGALIPTFAKVVIVGQKQVLSPGARSRQIEGGHRQAIQGKRHPVETRGRVRVAGQAVEGHTQVDVAAQLI